jgi:hypothetical protein
MIAGLILAGFAAVAAVGLFSLNSIAHSNLEKMCCSLAPKVRSDAKYRWAN